jgi:hypothetical protein
MRAQKKPWRGRESLDWGQGSRRAPYSWSYARRPDYGKAHGRSQGLESTNAGSTQSGLTRLKNDDVTIAVGVIWSSARTMENAALAVRRLASTHGRTGRRI